MPDICDITGPRVLNFNSVTFLETVEGRYIGRRTKWGNPFVMGRDGTREECVEKFRRYLWRNKTLLRAAVKELGGRDLICHCAPRACHGDVYLRAIAWAKTQPDF